MRGLTAKAREVVDRLVAAFDEPERLAGAISLAG